MEENADVEIDLVAADRRVHLVEDGLDAAVVISNDLENVVTHRLAKTARLLVASPTYVARHGLPERPADLAAHRWVIAASTATPSRHAHWTFTHEQGESANVQVRGLLVVTSVDLATQSAIDGTGITVSPGLLCQTDVDAGLLVRLLPRWSVGATDLMLIHGPTRDLPVGVRRFVDFLLTRFDLTPGIDGLVKAPGRGRSAT